MSCALCRYSALALPGHASLVCRRYPPEARYHVSLDGVIELLPSVFPLVTVPCGEFSEIPVAPPEGDLGVKMAKARVKKGE